MRSTQSYIDEALSLLQDATDQTSALGDKSFLLVLSRVLGILRSSADQQRKDEAKQAIASTATHNLANKAASYGVYPEPGSIARLSVRVYGNEGDAIPASTVGTGVVNQEKYYPSGVYTVGASGYVDVSFDASRVGSASNLRAGSIVELRGPGGTVNTEGVVQEILDLGTDPDTLEDLRDNLLDNLRLTTGGSNPGDFRVWGSSASNEVAWIEPYAGNSEDWESSEPGDRTVFVESTGDNRVPDQSLLDAVRSSIITSAEGIENQALGCVDSLLYVRPITLLDVVITVNGLNVEESQEASVKESIFNAVSTYGRNLRPYVQGLDPEITKKNTLTSVSLSGIVDEILKSYRSTASWIGFSIGGVPATGMTYELERGQRVDIQVLYND